MVALTSAAGGDLLDLALLDVVRFVVARRRWRLEGFSVRELLPTRRDVVFCLFLARAELAVAQARQHFHAALELHVHFVKIVKADDDISHGIETFEASVVERASVVANYQWG